jgi:hypothetical protein
VVTIPGDIGDEDLSNTVPPEPAPEPEVFVAFAMHPEDDSFYISVHSTKAGAHARIQMKAQEWAVPVEGLLSHVSGAVVETP